MAGPSAITQFVVLVLYSFLRLVINAVEAVRNVPPVLTQFSRTLGARPGPGLPDGDLAGHRARVGGRCRVAFAAAWGLQIVAELLGSPAGIGKLFAYLVPLLRPDLIIALIVWVTLVAVALDQWVLVPLVRWSTRWVPGPLERSESRAHPEPPSRRSNRG